ncbi:MAG: DUF262 domain-containing protein [Eubacterium sp.]
MDLKGAEIRNVKNLCSEMNSKESIPMRVTIPYYQRPYRWGKEYIGNLIKDFYKNEKNKYFVGSAVMVVSPEGKHDIIDGQQRITTMFLLAYLKFILQRAYVEEIINIKKTVKIDTALKELVDLSYIIFGENIGNRLKEVHTYIVKKLENDGQEEELYEHILKKYQEAVYLPEKNLSDEQNYFTKYASELEKLFKNCDLALKYKRDSYNKKLKQALSNFVIIMTGANNPQHKITYKGDDSLIKQYLNALEYEFKNICKHLPIEGKKPMDYTSEIIGEIELMLENINFCVIVTGNENDAYTLFEVLNDRALEIEDLDLIKNLFYKWYCNNTSEDERTVDSCIEEVDEIWVEMVFPPETGKERAKLISYFAATYFTADETLKYNDNERYREVLENSYLYSKSQYNSTAIKNDILIYQMIATLLKTIEVVFQKKNDMCIEAIKNTTKSVTYKTIHLLNALKQYGVLAALINVIIKKYVDNNINPDKSINFSRFQAYISDIANDANHNNLEYKDIHELAFKLWKNSLLSSSADKPREEAKRIIAKNNANSYDANYDPGVTVINGMKGEFEKWIDDWRYNKSDNDLRAKVLFLDLFQTDKKDDKLVRLATARTIRPDYGIELDHMEARNINEAMKEKYFEPKAPGDRREIYTDSIGNFMILDSADNNNKKNQPLEYALKYYEEMCPNHWMIEEVRKMLKDSKFAKETTGPVKYHVPTEDFFIERRARLKKYFLALLTRELSDKEMPIL